MIRPVLVIGMHRSGTSVLTRCLNSCGLAMGGDPKHLMPPRPEQPGGYWELEPLRQRNDELLALADGAWDRPPRTLPRWEGPELGRSAALLQRLMPDEPWLWKDPRNCLLLPHWHNVISATGWRWASPVHVFIHRHPDAVARSLQRHRGMPRQQAIELWHTYNWAACRYLQGRPVYTLDYGTLVNRPGDVLAAVCAFLAGVGAKVPAVPPAAAVAHVRRPDSALGTGGPAAALYRILLDIPAAQEAFAPVLGVGG